MKYNIIKYKKIQKTIKYNNILDFSFTFSNIIIIIILNII